VARLCGDAFIEYVRKAAPVLIGDVRNQTSVMRKAFKDRPSGDLFPKSLCVILVALTISIIIKGAASRPDTIKCNYLVLYQPMNGGLSRSVI